MVYALQERVPLAELAGEIVIPSAAIRISYFVLLVDCVEIGRSEGVRFAGIGAFYIDNLITSRGSVPTKRSPLVSIITV